VVACLLDCRIQSIEENCKLVGLVYKEEEIEYNNEESCREREVSRGGGKGFSSVWSPVVVSWSR